MNDELGARYYRLALCVASRRDLSGAALYAWYACILDPQRTDAVFLLGLCLYELGYPDAQRYFPAGFPAPAGEECAAMEEGLRRVRDLAARKKWKAAARAAEALPHQSVRALNIQGCLFALAERYTKAADCFAMAREKDRGSGLAQAGLEETLRRRKRLWGLL
ncbi:MAG: hypothetical protein LBQ57_13025 [Spirochaetales bacterium]|jgi:tetratricopeptide (TPR) repeat protein|nr:hypothetical protein [Spirochaetales bacterium]